MLVGHRLGPENSNNSTCSDAKHLTPISAKLNSNRRRICVPECRDGRLCHHKLEDMIPETIRLRTVFQIRKLSSLDLDRDLGRSRREVMLGVMVGARLRGLGI